MWKKIESEIQIDQLHEGEIIIKYPISGKPVDQIDFTDVKMLNRYEISKLTQQQEKYFEYELTMPIDEGVLNIDGTKITGATGNRPHLNKNSREFKSEKIWWLNETQ
jgi:hypothetical protein